MKACEAYTSDASKKKKVPERGILGAPKGHIRGIKGAHIQASMPLANFCIPNRYIKRGARGGGKTIFHHSESDCFRHS